MLQAGNQNEKTTAVWNPTGMMKLLFKPHEPENLIEVSLTKRKNMWSCWQVTIGGLHLKSLTFKDKSRHHMWIITRSHIRNSLCFVRNLSEK